MIAQLLIPIIYGIGENRFMAEKGETMIMNHFKLYHLWITVIFFLNAVSTWNVLQFLFLFIWAPLGLDATWWLIRYWDYHSDYEKAKQSYWGEPNAWHDRADWDNFRGLPLVAGCYFWWWCCGITCAILGMMIYAKPF